MNDRNTLGALAISVGLLFIVMWLLYMAVQEREQREACFVSQTWSVYERTTQRTPTNRDTVYEMSWNYTLKCDKYPHIELVFNSKRPTWAQIGDTIVFTPNIIH